MSPYGHASLPRKPSIQVEPRRHVCRMCGGQFSSPSGRAHYCPKCKETPAYKAALKARQRAAINRSEARRRNRA